MNRSLMRALLPVACLAVLTTACADNGVAAAEDSDPTTTAAAPTEQATSPGASMTEPEPLPDSPRIASIVDRGTLRVGALPLFPFLVQDLNGGAQPWAGPAWTLANAAADALGVELEVVAVSHETKVPVLASDQVDITIAPLSVTPARLEVVDFVEYSTTGVCYIGLASNEKFTAIDEFEDLDDPSLTLAYFQGQPTEELIAGAYPRISFRAVPGSGGIGAPLEEILSGRSDLAVVSPQATGPQVTRAYPEIITFPRGEDCLDSTEFAVPTGVAIDKGQPEFQAWLQDVLAGVIDEVAAEEARVVDLGIGIDIEG